MKAYKVTKKAKIKKIKPQMEFNVGLQKYEPVLPLKKSKNKVKVNWWVIVILMVIILLIATGAFLALKYGLIPFEQWN